MLFRLSHLCILGAILFPTILAATNCLLLGPDFSAPKHLSSSKTFQAALSSLKQAILQSLASGNSTNGPLDAVDTSFTMEIFSTHENTPLFSHQFTAPALASAPYGVKKVTADCMFRIGSSSKLFVVYTWLISVGDKQWNDPVTKCVPELQQTGKILNGTQNPIDHVAWEDITTWELASQMAGIG